MPKRAYITNVPNLQSPITNHQPHRSSRPLGGIDNNRNRSTVVRAPFVGAGGSAGAGAAAGKTTAEPGESTCSAPSGPTGAPKKKHRKALYDHKK